MRHSLLPAVWIALNACGQVPAETYTYKTARSCTLQADVHRLPGETPRPAILWLHGGALIFGHRGNLGAEQRQRYLREGFTVVSIDYRLAPETKLAGILEDLDDAWRWLRAQGPRLFRIDPDRIAVVGHSAGGYLTLTCGHRLRPRPAALVSFYGYGDIAGDWYSRPDPFYSRQPAVSKEEAWQTVGREPLSGTPAPNQRFRFYLYCRQQGIWPNEVAGHDPRSEPRAFDPLCPVRNVTAAWPPTLLLHGDQDTDVPFEQSEQMAREFKRHGVEHELIRIPGGPHGFDRKLSDPVVAEAFERVIRFLKERLIPPAPPREGLGLPGAR
ncbi:MAG: alpha/beta hydrolase [Acidobacteriota bacterium]